METKSPTSFMPLRRAASKLGVPVSWLKREAEAKRIPSIKAGRQLLIHLADAERVLADRAAEEGAEA